MTHQSALALANAQGNGWRLPHVKELASLVKTGGAGHDPVAFPGTHGQHWTSTPAVSIAGGQVVWSVDHGGNGTSNGIVNGSRLTPLSVRLVRNAQ